MHKKADDSTKIRTIVKTTAIINREIINNLYEVVQPEEIEGCLDYDDYYD